MKAWYCLVFCLLISCDVYTDCNAPFQSSSVLESRQCGLFLYRLHPHTPNDTRAPTGQALLQAEKCWVERAAWVKCTAGDRKIAATKGYQVILTLAHPLPGTMAITLNGAHPLVLHNNVLAYYLADEQLPQELTFQLYASATESQRFSNDNQFIKAWLYTKTPSD